MSEPWQRGWQSVLGRGLVAVGGLATLMAGAAWWGSGASAWAQRTPSGSVLSGELLALPLSGPNQSNWIALVDPVQRRMAVYEVSPGGQITLKSVRNLTWDLLLEEFNVGAPAPNEIQKLIRQ